MWILATQVRAGAAVLSADEHYGRTDSTRPTWSPGVQQVLVKRRVPFVVDGHARVALGAAPRKIGVVPDALR
jgi:hypothetical protein